MQDISAALARQFAEDEQSQRIYKLLLYITYGVWEAEVTSPTEMAMLGLVRQLLNQFPDRAVLTHHLHASVNTLSKPAAYSQLADFILDTVAFAQGTPLGDATSTFLRSPAQPSRTAEASEIDRRITLITETLTQHPKNNRLKKLMICVERSIWESDPSHLDAIAWNDILQSLYHQYPHLDYLTAATHKVVDRLSKPIEYAVIAQVALQQLHSLYQPLNLLPARDYASAFSPFTAEPLPDKAFLEETLATTTHPLTHSSTHPADLTLDPHDLTPVPLTLCKYESTPIASHIFDLRHDIIKSSNPLRVKHLLLMLTLNIDAQEALQSRTLRQESTLPLLATAFRLHRKPEILTIKLKEIARKLPAPEEYEGAIDAIVRAFKTQQQPDDRQEPGRIVPLRPLSTHQPMSSNF